MLGIKSQANLIFSKPEDFRSLDYDFGFDDGSNDKTAIIFLGASISLTYVFL